MNPTIQVSPSSDTGLVVAGQNITAKTGLGIVGGAFVGHMLLKKHGIIGALLGAAGGFFVGKKLDNPGTP